MTPETHPKMFRIVENGEEIRATDLWCNTCGEWCSSGADGVMNPLGGHYYYRRISGAGLMVVLGDIDAAAGEFIPESACHAMPNDDKEPK